MLHSQSWARGPGHSHRLSRDCHLSSLPYNQALGCHRSSGFVETKFYFVECPGSVCEMILVPLLLGPLDASRFFPLGSLLGHGAGRQELVGLGCLAPQRMGFCYHFSLCLRLAWDSVCWPCGRGLVDI